MTTTHMYIGSTAHNALSDQVQVVEGYLESTVVDSDLKCEMGWGPQVQELRI